VYTSKHISLKSFIFLSISCKTKQEDEDYFCESDSNVPVRFYEIHVSATDYGGHVANATATVVVVPKVGPNEEAALKNFKQEGLYNEKYFEYILAKEAKRYVLETKVLEWDII